MADAEHREQQELRERQAMRDVKARLTTSLTGTHAHDQITKTLDAVYQRFAGRPVRDFVPVLVERYAREELGAPPADVVPAIEDDTPAD